MAWNSGSGRRAWQHSEWTAWSPRRVRGSRAQRRGAQRGCGLRRPAEAPSRPRRLRRARVAPRPAKSPRSRRCFSRPAQAASTLRASPPSELVPSSNTPRTRQSTPSVAKALRPDPNSMPYLPAVEARVALRFTLVAPLERSLRWLLYERARRRYGCKAAASVRKATSADRCFAA